MKKAIRHIAIYLLTAIVLTATTGISVCCMFGCHDQEVASGSLDCCEKKVCELPVDQQKSGCPNCQSKYLSLDIDFLLTPFEFQLKSPVTIGYQPVISFSKKYILLKTTTPWENDLPPPPYGKNLLPHIQTFLC